MAVDAYREFLELSRCLNFTQAAQNLHLTQPALSKHIASLEREFGAELFKRDHRSVELTDAGRALCPFAVSIVDAYDEAVKAVTQARDRQPVRVDGVLLDGTVSAIVSLAALLLDQRGLAPLSTVHREDVLPIDLLVHGDIDIALTGIGDSDLDAHDLVRRPLLEVPFVAILDRSHPLAERSSIRMEELKDETFIHFVDSYAQAAWNNIAACCQRHGFTPRTRPVFGTTTTYTATRLDGAVLIQQANLRQLKFMEASGTVAVVPLSDRDACFTIDCVLRRADLPRLERHLDAFAEACKQTGPRGRVE